MIKVATQDDFEDAAKNTGLTCQIRELNKKLNIRVGDVFAMYPREGESNTKFSNRVSASFRRQGYVVSMRCRKGMGHALVKIIEVPQFNG